MLAPVVACVALAGLASILIRPTFESEASLRINQSASPTSLIEDQVPLGGSLGLLGLGESELDTDISVLRSRRVVNAVVDSLGLHVLLVAPDTLRSEVLDVIDAPAEAVAGTYELRRTSGGTYVLHSAKVRQANGRYTRSMEQVRQLVSPPAAIVIGRPFEIGGMTLALSPRLAATLPERVEFKVRPFDRYVAKVRDNDLRVRQVERGKIVMVEYRYPDPELAAAAVNAISDEFVSYKLSTSTSDAQSRVRVLQQQVASYENQLRDAEALLQRYQEEQLVIVPEEQATLQVERAAQLQVTRDAALVERQTLASVLESASRERTPGGESPYRLLATLPSLVTNGAIQGLLQSLIRLEDEREALLDRRTPDNRDVRLLDSRIQGLELQLYQLGRNYLSSLEERIASTTEALSGFDTELRALPAREIEFARLTRDRMLLSEVYLAIQEKLKEAEVLAAIENETGTVKVLDHGIIPERPVFPNPPVYLALGAILGLMVGVMAVVGRESLSTTIRSTADAELALDGVPVLGTIPAARGRTAGQRLLKGALPLRRLPSGRNGGIPLPGDVLRTGNRADAYRTLHANIAFAGSGESPRIIVLTSVAPTGSPSQEATSLAITLAQSGRRTVLVDGYLRDGRPHPLLGAVSAGAVGLGDVLAGRSTLDEAVQLVELDGSAVLFVLTAGDQTGSIDLLGSDALPSTMMQLRERYEAVVVDAPTLEHSLDAAIFGRIADATIVCVRTGETDQEELRDGVDRLRRLQVPVAGVVLSEG